MREEKAPAWYAKRASVALKALDVLGHALACRRGYVWPTEIRRAYERGVSALRAIERAAKEDA